MTENARRAAGAQYPRDPHVAITEPTTPTPEVDRGHGAVFVTPLSTHEDLIPGEPVVRPWPLGGSVLLEDRDRGIAGVGFTSRSRLRQHRYRVRVHLRVSSEGASDSRGITLVRLCESSQGHRCDSCPIGQGLPPARAYQWARKAEAVDQRVYADNPPMHAKLSNNTGTRRHTSTVRKTPCVNRMRPNSCP
jgi:hypothetical protein